MLECRRNRSPTTEYSNVSNTPLPIYIGYDPNEKIALHVLAHSIMTRASRPVAIIPLMQQSLRLSGAWDRERGPTESTEFSLTRFMVPFLSDYRGVSIFMDCDILCRCDITELEFEMRKFEFSDQGPAVLVCKHDYTPKSVTKFLGQQQTNYKCKNWSSMMVFNNAKCKALTLDYVNTATGLDLHRFNWLEEEQVGGLPLDWNWLVGEYEPNPDARCLHYTLGGPWFKETERCDQADLWFEERASIGF